MSEKLHSEKKRTKCLNKVPVICRLCAICWLCISAGQTWNLLVIYE